MTTSAGETLNAPREADDPRHHARPGVEIERKFLARELPPKLDGRSAERISQGYLVAGEGTLEVRLRRRGENTTLTIKKGLGRSRREEEIAIEPERFDRLWPLTEHQRVEKVRHLLPIDGGVVEVDVYAGALDGLATAEVEFDSEAEADAFEPPRWFGPELTEDPRYKNQRLARDGAPKPPRVEPEPFALHRGEPLGMGIRRIVRGQIDLAIDQLGAGAGEDSGKAVHECRKSFKRVRATLRLLRDELGEETCRQENAAFRELGRQLSGARDSQVLVETLDAVHQRHADELHPGAFAQPRAVLVADHEAAERHMREDSEANAAVIANLRTARQRVAGWDLEHDGLDALAPGFARIYRRGRRAYRAARQDPSDENFHELRKRTKDLWHAAEILAPASPKTMQALADTSHRLSKLVGDDHDLAVLAQHTARHSHRVPDKHEAAHLDALIRRRRDKTQKRALKVAGRLFARKPKKLARRLKETPIPSANEPTGKLLARR